MNAKTPEEIAISIMSEIMMFKLGGSGKSLKLDDNLIEKALSKKDKTIKESQFY